MVGHLAVPSITGDNTPASISKALITDFLKGEMGYKGLVVTDALNMNALTNYYSQDEIYVKAVEAGVDILLMPSSSRNALNSVKRAVEDGRITEKRINESVKKILTLKYEKRNFFYLSIYNSLSLTLITTSSPYLISPFIIAFAISVSIFLDTNLLIGLAPYFSS